MGTYLAINAFDTFPDHDWGRIVLAGSVLPRTFDWNGKKKRDCESFIEVRNEMGGGDWVVWAVGWVAILIPSLGASGHRGFLGKPRDIHFQDTEHGPCKPCVRRICRAPVHNVLLKKFRHSDAFLTNAHCEALWLPFLWGYEPSEYKRFRRMCAAVVRFELAGDSENASDAAEELLLREWSWIGRRKPSTLKKYIESRIDRLGTAHHLALTKAQATDHAVRLMCRLFRKARAERHAYPHSREAIVLRLHPRTVLGCALTLVTPGK